jgi:hypothetical protein
MPGTHALVNSVQGAGHPAAGGKPWHEGDRVCMVWSFLAWVPDAIRTPAPPEQA